MSQLQIVLVAFDPLSLVVGWIEVEENYYC